MADVEHRLAAGSQLPLQPPLARNVEEVVGLVEQQDVVVAAQEDLQGDALLLATGERPQWSRRGLLERDADGAGQAFVPVHLEVVAAVVAPVGERVRVRHRIVFRSLLRLGEPDRRSSQRWRSQRHEQLTSGQWRVGITAGHADELAHHAETAVHADGALARTQLPGDQAQQRRLADSVGADQRRPLAVADAEADVAQQLVAARPAPADVADLDRAHHPTLGRVLLAERSCFGLAQHVT